MAGALDPTPACRDLKDSLTIVLAAQKDLNLKSDTCRNGGIKLWLNLATLYGEHAESRITW
jgi:hypothetical protein